MPTINATIKVYPSAELTAQDFAMLINSLTPEDDGRLYGCTIKANGTSISLTGGWCVLHGRLVRVKTNNDVLDVTKPTSGTRTRYAVLSINLVNGNVALSVRSSVPEDTANFNTATGDSIMAYLSLAELTIGPNGVTKVVTTPYMRPHDNLLYRYTKKKKELHGDKNSEYTLQLKRNGCMVSCHLFYDGIIPKEKVNKEHSLGIIIPEGYRPTNPVWMPYFQTNGTSVNGGRGEWIALSSGKIYGYSNYNARSLRMGMGTWVTDDEYPGKSYEEVDDT